MIGPWIQVVRPLDPSCVEADTTRRGGTGASFFVLRFGDVFFGGFFRDEEVERERVRNLFHGI